MIEITSDEIERVGTMLADTPKSAERVFANAMNRGLSRIKTRAIEQVKKVYAVKTAALWDATTARMNKASVGNLVGFVSFSGVKIPLYKFSVTPTKPATRQKVKAGLMNGGSKTEYEDAFIAEMKNGHIGVFERTGTQGIESRKTKYGKQNHHTEKIKEISGLSTAQMIGNASNIEILEKEAQELVNERIVHEMNRILNGYGGKA